MWISLLGWRLGCETLVDPVLGWFWTRKENPLSCLAKIFPSIWHSLSLYIFLLLESLAKTAFSWFFHCTQERFREKFWNFITSLMADLVFNDEFIVWKILSTNFRTPTPSVDYFFQLHFLSLSIGSETSLMSCWDWK